MQCTWIALPFSKGKHASTAREIGCAANLYAMVDVSYRQRHILLLLENASYELGTGDGNGMVRRRLSVGKKFALSRNNEATTRSEARTGDRSPEAPAWAMGACSLSLLNDLSFVSHAPI